MDTSRTTTRPTGFLARLASASVRHRRLVVLAWLVVIVVAALANRSFGGDFDNDLSVPETDSQAAFDELRERFPERAGDPLQIVVHDPEGVTGAATVDAVESVLDDIRTIDGVSEVRSPYAGPAQAVSEDGSTALATVQFAERAKDIPDASIEAVQEAATPLTDLGLQVEFGGPPMEKEHGPSGSEAIGLIAAMVILLLAFGSVVAMFIPIGVALAALALGIQSVELLAEAVTIGTAGPVVAAMIGLGVGIDYALLIVTRHRENTARGMTPEDSIPVAMATAGRSVLVAGLTVIVAILSLYLIGIDFVAAIGLASATTVATTLLASVTLLPALLGFAGRNIDRWSIRAFHHEGRHESARGWRRWIAGVQRHPWLSFGASLLVLLVLAVPLFSMRLGSGDASSNPTSDTTRRAYDLVSEGFGPGYNGPLLITVTDPDGFTVPEAGGSSPMDRVPVELRQLWSDIGATEGVAAVAPPELNVGADTAVLAVIPTTGPQAEETEDLVHALRDDVIPTATAEADVEVHVGGPTAVAIDLADKMADRLPIFMAGILVLSFLLLMVEFRSLFVPFKAALMNLLSIGAAYGAVVAVFQWGWLSDVFGQSTGPIESFAPMMLFAVLFGLSMDYEVFLLSRVREEYEKTGDNSQAVAVGISSTARVITAAASVMIIVFGSFLLNDQRVVNMFGFGLAVAIFVDATIVRTVLVPATMELAGKANWWLPRWLDRLLPRFHVAATADGAPVEDAVAVDPGTLDELRSTLERDVETAADALISVVADLEKEIALLQGREGALSSELDDLRTERREAEQQLSGFRSLVGAVPVLQPPPVPEPVPEARGTGPERGPDGTASGHAAASPPSVNGAGSRLARRQRLNEALQDVAGVGAAERAVLVEAYGSVEAAREATVEELSRIPEIGDRLAEHVHAALRGRRRLRGRR